MNNTDDEDNLDIQAALTKSRRTKYRPQGDSKVSGVSRTDRISKVTQEPTFSLNLPTASATSSSLPAAASSPGGFDGPLPFESLNLETSILERKKKRDPAEPTEGFEKEPDTEASTQPLPPWFSGDIREADAAQKAIEDNQYKGANSDHQPQLARSAAVLKRQETNEVIDLETPRQQNNEVIDMNSSNESDADDIIRGPWKQNLVYILPCCSPLATNQKHLLLTYPLHLRWSRAWFTSDISIYVSRHFLHVFHD